MVKKRQGHTAAYKLKIALKLARQITKSKQSQEDPSREKRRTMSLIATEMEKCHSVL